MEQRYYWGDVLQELRAALIRSEDDIKKKLSAQRPGVEAGIWIETLTTAPNLGGAAGLQSSQDAYPQPNVMNPYMRGYPQPTQPTPAPPHLTSHRPERRRLMPARAATPIASSPSSAAR